VKWSSIFCMFGMALTRPSLTTQLTSGVNVFAHVRAKGGHFDRLLWQYEYCRNSRSKCPPFAIWQEAFLFLSNVKRFLDCFFWKSPQFQTYNFRKVVRQHTEGMVESIIWVLLEIYLSFQQWKNFNNPLRIDKIIAMSLVYYYFWDTVCIYTVYIRCICMYRQKQPAT